MTDLATTPAMANEQNRLDVLHLPETVGGMAFELAQAEKTLGVNAEVLALYGNYLTYPADHAMRLERYGSIRRVWKHLYLVAKFRRGYDAYHFNYGSSIIHFLNRGILLWDLPFYDRMARKIFTYNGCDARQKYPTMARNKLHGKSIAACFETDCYGGLCNSGKVDRNRRASIDKAAKYADHIFAVNPDLLYFLPPELSSFMPYAVAGFRGLPPRTRPFFENDQVHIVHAPTQRAAKGSKYILAALDELKAEMGGRLRVTLVEGMPHAQALATYADADLFIDQVLIGWYGGVAVEVMKMGIPVMCFINDDHLRFIPQAMAAELPILQTTPFDIADRIRAFLRDRDQVAELAARGLRYVNRWHDPRVAATLSTAAYRGQNPGPPVPIASTDTVTLPR